MFEVGDYVNIVFTGAEYDAFINHSEIYEAMKKNPHLVQAAYKYYGSNNPRSYRYKLQGSMKCWPPSILELATKQEPDWVI